MVSFSLPATSKVFMATAVIEALFITVGAIIAIADYYEDGRLAYYVLSGVCAVALLYFARSAVWNENTFELLAFLAASTAATVFAIIKYLSAENQRTLYLASLIVLCVFQVIYFISAYFVHKNFGYRLYKKLGGRPEKHVMYKTYMIFMSLVKIDCFYNIFLVLLAGFFVLQNETVEIAIDTALVAVTIVWAFWLRYSVRHEKKMSFFLAAAFAFMEPVYIIFKVVDMSQNPSKYNEDDSTLKVGPFVAAALVGLVIRALLLAWMVFAYRNFGQHVHDNAIKLDREPFIVVHHGHDKKSGPPLSYQTPQTIQPTTIQQQRF